MKPRVVGVGAGGHAKVVVDILRTAPVEIVGLLERNAALWGTRVLGVKVLGGDDLLPQLRGDGVTHAFIGVGCTGDTAPRRRLHRIAKEHGFEIVSAIHATAVISQYATIGPGATLMPGSVVNAGTTLGENVIVNSGAIVEHDCTIGDHVHIATGARLASAVRVGHGSHIGLGASVRERCRIGRDVIVGAGAVVVDDVPDGVVVVGVPARVLSQRTLA